MRRALIVLSLASAFVACKPKPPTSPHCVNNAEIQFKRIDEAKAKYQGGQQPPGTVYWARYYLETARFVLTGKGIDGSGAACTAPDRDSKDYDRLMMGLEARGHDVEGLETQRGVKFVEVKAGRPAWTWQKTGEAVPSSDANTL